MLFWVIAFFATVEFVTTLLPFVPWAHGVFRVFEFPRIQSAWIAGLALLAGLLFLDYGVWTYILFVMLATSLAIQLVHIARFTPLWWRKSRDYKGQPKDAPVVSLMAANVKLSNDDKQALANLVNDMQPDLVIFMETDQSWIDYLSKKISGYEQDIRCPADNGYGLYLISKLPLTDVEIEYLLNPEVPSFHLTVECPTKDRFRLIAVHPEPPVIQRETTGRDAELAVIADIARDMEEPLVVCGDLNDVAWSRTTRRFLRISRLLDPREGRGQYNTFHADYALFRWPLDHIFHSAHFQLVDMKRLPHIGSDHFPMYYELALTEREKARHELDEASHQDFEEAEKIIEDEKESDDRPIGTDWEK